jgi:hypothetical protein
MAMSDKKKLTFVELVGGLAVWGIIALSITMNLPKWMGWSERPMTSDELLALPGRFKEYVLAKPIVT